MTPAEHYAEAERLLEAHQAWQERNDKVDYVAAEATFRLAQVHATLATVDPAHLGQLPPPVMVDHPGWMGRIEGAEMTKGCTCPALAANPIARTGLDPDCPIHGETP